MNEHLKAALEQDKTIDITTIGRKSGQPRRIEIWFHRIKGRTYITGTPGKRGWYANLVANPNFVFHLKESVVAEMPAFARPITNHNERRQLLATPELSWYRNQGHTLEDLVQSSPLVEVLFEEGNN